MPRTTQQIIEHADELAAAFIDFEPTGPALDGEPLRELAQISTERAELERRAIAAVDAAREAGHTWESIGAMLGTSASAAHQRYGPRAATTVVPRSTAKKPPPRKTKGPGKPAA